jgi:hypothetical protein
MKHNLMNSFYRYDFNRVSSLNDIGFTNLDNTTNINGSLYISGLNILDTLIHLELVYQLYIILDQIMNLH